MECRDTEKSASISSARKKQEGASSCSRKRKKKWAERDPKTDEEGKRKPASRPLMKKRGRAISKEGREISECPFTKGRRDQGKTSEDR